MLLRYAEHKRYMKANEPKSAYALHILNNRHEYGTIHSTMKVLKRCRKGKKNEHFGKLLHAKVPTRRITHTRTDAT